MTAYERIHEAYTAAAYNSRTPTPRSNRLYADAWLAWGESRGDRSTALRTLLRDLSTRREELTPEQDAEMRRTYKLEEKA